MIEVIMVSEASLQVQDKTRCFKWRNQERILLEEHCTSKVIEMLRKIEDVFAGYLQKHPGILAPDYHGCIVFLDDNSIDDCCIYITDNESSVYEAHKEIIDWLVDDMKFYKGDRYQIPPQRESQNEVEKSRN